MAKEYYFISDLHIGGDEALGVCDYESELVGFLKDLSTKGDQIQLIIVGDIFGMWEFTDIKGVDKLNALIDQFPNIFEAFRQAGSRITITMLPGNHDYEIACYPEYVEIFKQYNIRIEQQPSTVRELAGKRIWIEHGNQYDEYNQMPDFGNPHALPVGYFVTSAMVSGAGKHSQYGRYNWLKDIQSVYPTEDIPYWMMSNYFYHEMSPWLRWVILPFLGLWELSLLVLAGGALEWFGVTETNIFLNNTLFASLGYLGNLVQIVIILNTIIFLVLAVLLVPILFIIRDVKKTLKRFRVITHPQDLNLDKEKNYLDAAQAVFDKYPDTVIFIYGHTHDASLTRLGNRLLINTGTWLKRLVRSPVRFGYLPDIYVPSYFLDYFKIAEKDGCIIVDFMTVNKAQPKELSLLQRILVSKTSPEKEKSIPARTVLEF